MRMTSRERLLALALLIFTSAWFFFALAVRPASERIRTLTRVIPEKQDELRKLRAAAGEYVVLRDRLDDLKAQAASQEADLELLPFLESLTKQCGLDKNVAVMKQYVSQLQPKYDETVVEIRLQSVALNQLVDFLAKIGPSNIFAQVESLHIKKNRTKAELLDSTIHVHNTKLAKD